ncbi:MAG: HAD-IB family hydrolase [Actinomycetota bacterium]
MASTAAFFDLDRTLLRGSSAPFFAESLVDEGVTEQRSIPLADLGLRIYEEVGEIPVAMIAARRAVREAAGWSVDAVARAAATAADQVADELQPFAPLVFEQHRKAGDLLVLATTSPHPLVEAIGEALGFDAVICTRWEVDGDQYSGELDGPFVWGTEKAAAVKAWADENGVRLARSTAYSDSYYDSPMLDLVGTAVAVNPDAQLAATAVIKGWEIRHLDKNEGVAKIAGREMQDWSRPFMRPELVAPFADLQFEGVEKIPSNGGAIIVFNHRSYFDPTVMGLLIARGGRSIRGLGKKEVFDVPFVGPILKALGGIRVERASGSDEPLELAEQALLGGEVVMMAPQGTIPRGPAFFDPELKGRWGAARLAARAKVPVIPVGIWGTEQVWPRSARLPKLVTLDRPTVTAVVGDPVELAYESADDDTKTIMAAISELLPPEAREPYEPTDAELAATFPPGYKGDPTAEADRRPGTDTAGSQA